VFIVHLAGFSEDQAYRVMDPLLDALGEIASEVFSSVAHLLNPRSGHRVRGDTTSTCWEVEVADELVDALSCDAGDDETAIPIESASHRSGIPWTFAVICRRW
jgi:hypothetical protein